MALVFGVTAASTSRSSRFMVSARTSTNTGFAPRSTKALAVDTKVKDGMMISSPSPTSANIAAISNAAVQEWVNKARLAFSLFSNQA